MVSGVNQSCVDRQNVNGGRHVRLNLVYGDYGEVSFKWLTVDCAELEYGCGHHNH
jgi:hypothetical protein